MTQFGTILNTPPSLTWVGTRSAATKELATRVDAKWLLALKQKDPREWWLPFMDQVPVDEDTEVAKMPIDFEDLGAWQELDGQRVARDVKPLQYQTVALKPFYKDRTIKSRDIKRNAFGNWPDRLSALMLAARRTVGVLFRDMLFSTGSNGLGSKFYTYQGGQGGTQPFIYPSGHYCDPTEGSNSQTFGNLHTGADQNASGNALFVKGATAFNIAGWEAAEAEYMGRPGPGGVPLDMRITFVLGGSRMKPKFKRMFNRVLVLEDSTSGPAAAATSNIHSMEALDAAYGEERVIPVVTGWLDAHPYALANPTADQWWTLSTTYPARPVGWVAARGGAPEVKVLDIGSEYETQHDRIYIKGTMDMNVAAAFPHVFDEWRST